MDHIQDFNGTSVHDAAPLMHVRVAMYPDGGVSRLRLFGRKS